MKKEINANDIIYMIAIFVMPIVTFIGVTKLQTDIINISDVIKVGASDYNTLFLADMIIFITCWVALFISYILYKSNIKLAQGVILLGSIAFLIYNIYLAINSYGSISSIINPLIVLSTSIYALCKPVSKMNMSISLTSDEEGTNADDPINEIEEVTEELMNSINKSEEKKPTTRKTNTANKKITKKTTKKKTANKGDK